jgi:FKBP12-rapamycin complex-associated protein
MSVQMAPLASHAAWNMCSWDQMGVYVSHMDPNGMGASTHQASSPAVNVAGLVEGSPVGALDSSGSLAAFFCAVLHVHNARFPEAQRALERARWLLGTELSALVGESYERAYTAMVRVQQLTELEEVRATPTVFLVADV